jgi:hypothetical protein
VATPGSCVPVTTPIIFFNTFSLRGSTRGVRFVLYLSCPSPRGRHSVRSPGSFSRERHFETKKKVLGMPLLLIARCSYSFLKLGNRRVIRVYAENKSQPTSQNIVFLLHSVPPLYLYCMCTTITLTSNNTHTCTQTYKRQAVDHNCYTHTSTK